ncbi:MAG: UvrD-helicase domain-containing protein, partial [Anaerolineaceae bacterium]|nr:UvrD-helicase domain-containing protein [Anaerolineaceae bacterium]
KALLVDEFQDTNDAQAELFSLLNPSRSLLFAVGDKKQSIYGFRGTNVALFDRRGEEVKLSNGLDIMLDTTYRTEPGLLLPMGSMLEQVMADPVLSQKDYYAAYEPMKNPEKPAGKPDPLLTEPPCIELLLSDIEKEDDPDGEITGRMLAQRLTELMAAGRLQTWNDAVILCRNSNDFKQFEKALAAWQIPYVTVAGKGYYDRPEIRDVLNILQAAENPNDNAALTGFLLSPSIGFSVEMTALLYRYANRGGIKMSFYQALKDSGFSFEDGEKQKKLDKARSVLEQLIHISGQVPLDEVLEVAYRLTGIRTMLALDSGDRAWLNLDKLIPVARESKMTSVSEFLEYLKGIQETGAREGEAPSDNNGAVRIMTIHQAKGLEFKVTVIYDNEFGIPKLPNFLQNADGGYAFCSSPAHPRFSDAKRHAEAKDKAEWLRLFYVAATRAKYRLILCGKKPDMSGKADTWLKRMLFPLTQECPDDGEYAGPAWGIEGLSVWIRCCKELPAVPFEDVNPSGARIEIAGDYSLLGPAAEQRQQKSRSPEHTAALTVGKLVHKGLELWRFPDENGIDTVLRDAFDRVLLQTDNLDPDERQTVLEKAEMLLARFRDSEVRKLIETAEDRRHEIPFSFTRRNTTVNGVIDLLIKDGNGYTIIDFKTDEINEPDDFSRAMDKHKVQIGKYREALRIITGAEPACRICFLDCFGKVQLQPVGKEPFPENEEAIPDEWIPDDPGADDYWFEEIPGPDPLFPPDA